MFVCPTCGLELIRKDRAYVCENNHNFDISAKGYVNLLMSQNNKNKRHGDDKTMLRARQDFLNKGYYKPLLEELSKVINNLCEENPVIFDAGCGECWYTYNIFETIKHKKPTVYAIDISKNAFEVAGKIVTSKINCAVASIFKIPIANNSCDILMNVFAPYSHDEFLRVLKKGRYFIRVVPLKKHLYELKKAVYESVYDNDEIEEVLAGYVLHDHKELEYEINLNNNSDITNLFMMTPYYYKTSKTDFKKLKNLDFLDTKIAFGIQIYKKI